MQTWFDINFGDCDLAIDRFPLILGCTTDLFIDTTKAAREFGVQLTSLDEYVQKVLANAPIP